MATRKSFKITCLSFTTSLKSKDLQVFPSDTVLSIRQKLGEEWATGEILCNYKQFLEDDRLTLYDYYVGEGAILILRWAFSIDVKAQTGKITKVNVDTFDTVENLRAKIQDTLGIPLHQQRLIFKGKQIEFSRYLVQYNILSTETIFVILRLFGGGNGVGGVTRTLKNKKTGKSVDHNFSENITVSDLKRAAFDEGLVDEATKDQPLVIFSGQTVLEDHKTLEDYPFINASSYIEVSYYHDLKFTVYVKMSGNPDINLKVDSTITIKSLKSKIYESKSIHVQSQHLFHNGVYMEDSKPLHDFHPGLCITVWLFLSFVGTRSIHIDFLNLERIAVEVSATDTVASVKGKLKALEELKAHNLTHAAIPMDHQDIIDFEKNRLSTNTTVGEVVTRAMAKGIQDVVLVMKLSQRFCERLDLFKMLRKESPHRDKAATLAQLVTSEISVAERIVLLSKPLIGQFCAIQLGLLANKHEWHERDYYVSTLQLEEEGFRDLIRLKFSDGSNLLQYLAKCNIPSMLKHCLKECEQAPDSVISISECSALVKFALLHSSDNETLLTVLNSPVTKLDRGGLIREHLIKLLLKAIQHPDDAALKKVCDYAVHKIELSLSNDLQEVKSLSRYQAMSLNRLCDRYIISPVRQAVPHAIVCYNTDNRPGAEKEARTLINAFDAAQFCVAKRNWRLFHEMQAWLAETMDQIRDKCSVVFISLMSHGFKGYLAGDEGSYGPANDLLEMMEKCLPTWIPVVILIQACQGATMPESTVSTENDAGPSNPLLKHSSLTLRRRHTVLLLATVMGRYAIRGAYTTAIANQLTKSDGRTTIDVMHTRAVAHLQADAIDGYDQIPEIRHTLNKQLILPAAKADEPSD